MRVVLYLRVSTEKQADRGRSLEDQERRARAWAERTGHTIVASYSDARSGWSRRGSDGRMRESAEARDSFRRMVAEFTGHRADVVLVDTLDRWSRTLREGLNTLELLRGHRVGLLPLDWERDDPIDVDNDSDWSLVVRYFVAAEDENRSRSRRMRRSWEGRRARGAPMRNVAPFGLVRVGDAYEAGPDAAIIADIDNRYLAGENIADILTWLLDRAPGAWSSRNGLRTALLSTDYVRARVRTPETAQAIRALMASRKSHHGARRKHAHEFAGVFACGRCVELGFAPQDALMGESLKQEKRTGEWRPAINCQDSGSTIKLRHRPFSIAVSRIAAAWLELLEFKGEDAARLADEWARAGSDVSTKRRALERSLGRLDGDEAKIAARRDAALDLMAEEPAARRQAVVALTAIDADLASLHARRQVVLSDLAALSETPRDANWLREQLENYRSVYAECDLATRNRLNRLLCVGIGSPPVLSRSGNHRWAPISLTWDSLSVSIIVPAARNNVPAAASDARRARRYAAGKCTRCGSRHRKNAISPRTGEPYRTCAACLSNDAAGHLRRKATRAETRAALV